MLEYFKRSRGQKGFTLIELLVVIAIIGILATIVLVSLNTARSKARDTRRISDLRQVALAMEMYYDSNPTVGFPGDGDELACNDWAGFSVLTPTYMGALPTDPGTYAYAAEVSTSKQDYVLRAQLENNVPEGDVDGTVYGCDCVDTTNKYYCIQP